MHRTQVIPFAVQAASLLALAACVTQERYDDAQLSAKHYQNEHIRQSNELARLEEENQRLRAELDASKVQIQESNFTGEIDQRLDALRSTLKELGSAPGDVTKFAVDGGYVYRVKESVVFPLGSAEVSPAGRAVLDQIAADINSQPFARVYVRGHTDDLPVSRPETKAKFPHGNLQLSAARAVEVGAYLAENAKVDSKRLVTMGFGPSEPVAPNNSEANRQLNRRVEIFVADAAGAQRAAPASAPTKP
jgi:flagellar motor protein MotB